MTENRRPTPDEVKEAKYTSARLGIIDFLEFLGEDPARDGLQLTPDRFLKAMQEMTSGYYQNPDEILSTSFEQSYDEMIVLSNMAFTSVCEHHLLPFSGIASIGYIPYMTKTGYDKEGNKIAPKVVGISKLARLLDCFAKRLQIQERMAAQIAQAIEKNLNPVGIGVSISAKHLCMSCRGVKKSGIMTTNYFTGAIKHEPSARAEFLSTIQLFKF